MSFLAQTTMPVDERTLKYTAIIAGAGVALYAIRKLVGPLTALAIAIVQGCFDVAKVYRKNRSDLDAIDARVQENTSAIKAIAQVASPNHPSTPEATAKVDAIAATDEPKGQ